MGGGATRFECEVKMNILQDWWFPFFLYLDWGCTGSPAINRLSYCEISEKNYPQVITVHSIHDCRLKPSHAKIKTAAYQLTVSDKKWASSTFYGSKRKTQLKNIQTYGRFLFKSWQWIRKSTGACEIKLHYFPHPFGWAEVASVTHGDRWQWAVTCTVFA